MTATRHLRIDNQTYTLTTNVGSGRIKVGYSGGPQITMWDPDCYPPWVGPFEGFEAFQAGGHQERLGDYICQFNQNRLQFYRSRKSDRSA